MDHYIIASDGSITLGPTCLGVVKFKDGHFEPITHVDVITLAHFQFSATSGRYAYKQVQTDEPIPYWDNTPFMYISTKPRFAKANVVCLDRYYNGSSRWGVEWEEIDTIEQVFINTNLCPELKG